MWLVLLHYYVYNIVAYIHFQPAVYNEALPCLPFTRPALHRGTAAVYALCYRLISKITYVSGVITLLPWSNLGWYPCMYHLMCVNQKHPAARVISNSKEGGEKGDKEAIVG